MHAMNLDAGVYTHACVGLPSGASSSTPRGEDITHSSRSSTTRMHCACIATASLSLTERSVWWPAVYHHMRRVTYRASAVPCYTQLISLRQHCTHA